VFVVVVTFQNNCLGRVVAYGLILQAQLAALTAEWEELMVQLEKQTSIS
jgi:hypothetical protein